MKNKIQKFLVFGSLASIGIYNINKLINIYSNAKNLLKTERGNFFEWKYGNIFYTKQGKGSPVLLIHNLCPASSSYEWEKISKYLSKSHTVYNIDLLGCGRSDKPNITYSNYLFVQLITDFTKKVIGEKTDLIAAGESSSFTLMACNMEPEQFHKVIVINPSNLVELCKTPNKIKNTLKFLIELPIFGTMIYNLAFREKNIRNTFYRDYFYQNHMIPSRIIDTYHEGAHKKESHGKYLYSSIKSNYTNINIVHALKNIKNNIYLIGSKGNPHSEKIIDSYISYNSSIKSSYISESKYLPQLEVPEKLLAALNSCLEDETIC